jgi:hypothetical protein
VLFVFFLLFVVNLLIANSWCTSNSSHLQRI